MQHSAGILYAVTDRQYFMYFSLEDDQTRAALTAIEISPAQAEALAPGLPPLIAKELAPRVAVGAFVKSAPSHLPQKQLSTVKNVVPVFSAKGGVGKSSIAAKLALNLHKLGANVGLLDADIYGPSIGKLFGVEDKRPELLEGTRFYPLKVAGIEVISMTNLTVAATPVIWRGPKASGALQHMLYQTQWSQLDYLIIDMPPGTGDIPLSLLQGVGVAGSLIITTPQDLSLIDVRKGISMFEKLNVPILGIVENMISHQCSKCGNIDHPFGESGARKLAEQTGISYLQALPLSCELQNMLDTGRADSSSDGVLASPIARILELLAVQISLQLAKRAMLTQDPLIVSQ